MNEVRNTYLDFTLNNEQTVKLTLTFGKLNILKSVNNDLYNRFNRVLYGKSDDMLDLVAIVYAAYWCANYNMVDKLYSEQEFIELVPFDMDELKSVFTTLTQPKKK